MKSNIEHVPYKKCGDKYKDKIKWYSWDETCDKCGNTIKRKYEFLSSEKPEENKNDFCINCLRSIFE